MDCLIKSSLVAIMLVMVPTTGSLAASESETNKTVVEVPYDANRHCIHDSKLYSAGAIIIVEGKRLICGYTQHQTSVQLAGAIWRSEEANRL